MLPSWSFLVESTTGQKALFDLGVPRDQETGLSPSIRRQIEAGDWDLQVEKDVVQTLADNDVDPKEINSIIWRLVHEASRSGAFRRSNRG